MPLLIAVRYFLKINRFSHNLYHAAIDFLMGQMMAATFDPTKRTSLITVADMCRKIEENSISLPLYQCDISWTLQKCMDLLNYQLWGKAPVSPISIHVINTVDNAVPQVSFIDREIIAAIERGQYAVVDGQQRLTTNYKAYCNHDDFRNIVLDLGKGEFAEVRDSIRSNQIPVGILLNKEDAKLFESCVIRLLMRDMASFCQVVAL